MGIDTLSQIAIGLGSIITATLVSGKTSKLRRWGFIVALIIQPAWMYTTFIHHQWAMFAVTFYYTYRNWCGFINNKHGEKNASG